MDIMKSLTIHEPLAVASPDLRESTIIKYQNVRSRINAMRNSARNGIIRSEEITMGEHPIINDEWTKLTSNLLEDE